jgi:branched-subunit amino acid ABC-type transport system permease component
MVVWPAINAAQGRPMLIGHYAAALVAKAAQPQVPLWQLFFAAQLVDIAWVCLSWWHLEYFLFDFTLASNPLVLVHQPYSHSLLAVLLWALGLVGLYWVNARHARCTAALLGAVAASHWLLDLVVHRPDLPIWPDIKVGLALWNWQTPAMALELTLIVATTGLLLRTQTQQALRWYAGFCLLLLAVIVVNYQMAEPHTVSTVLSGAMAVYLISPALAWWIERRARQAPATSAMAS